MTEDNNGAPRPEGMSETADCFVERNGVRAEIVHRHGIGIPCLACEINQLRADGATLRERIGVERVGIVLEIQGALGVEPSGDTFERIAELVKAEADVKTLRELALDAIVRTNRCTLYGPADSAHEAIDKLYRHLTASAPKEPTPHVHTTMGASGPEPPEPPLRELSAFKGAVRPARSRKERIEMTTPEPSTLKFTADEVRGMAEACRKEGAALDNEWPEPDEYSPVRGGDAERKCADILDAFADLLEARAARPSPTCATCKHYAQTADPTVKVCINESEIDGGPNDWYVPPTFSCNQHEPSPPAQDGGRP